MDQKGHIVDQKGLKMYEKGQKNTFFGPKMPVFSRIMLCRIGENPSAQNP